MTDPRPGDRQHADNKQHKRDLGSSPNGVANQFLSALRDKKVTVYLGSTAIAIGTLVRFDAYSMVVLVGGVERLVFKGPGVVVTPE